MKKTSALSTFFIVLLVPVVWISLSLPTVAQQTAQDQKTAGTTISLKSTVQPAKSGTNTGRSTPSPAVNKKGAVKQAANVQKWFDRGALCATYGNDKAAIRYFQKAIALDPQRSNAYFSQGISYGQLGEYIRAIALVNKAIELNPENGLYYYGRGRVYLLAGEKEEALADFKKAAALDDEDAQAYLQRIAQAP